MSKNFVITIGREYGSGGHEIAEKLAQKLNIPCYDKNMLKIIAEERHMNAETLLSKDEKPLNPFADPYNAYGIGTSYQAVFQMQSSFIQEKAKEEPCIIVGRCSDYILRDLENAFHFFIYAPVNSRIERIMKVENIAEDLAALRIIKKIDKQRKMYYQFYTDRKWSGTEGKDLMINSSVLEIDECVNLIEDYLKLRGCKLS